MPTKPQYKKIIAREILVFFSASLLVLLLWVFALLRNGYYQHEINIGNEKIISLSNRMNSLPTDYNVRLYNVLKANNDTFENSFSSFESKLKSKNYIGFVYDKYIPKVKKSTSVNHKLKEITDPDILESTEVTDSSLIGLLNFEFSTDSIKSGFGYNDEIRNERINIPLKIFSLGEKANDYRSRLLDNNAMYKLVSVCSILVAGIAYLLRFSILIILWALKNIKA